MTVRIEKPAINVREELADLRKPTGIAGEAMLRADTPQEQFNLIGAGRRNLVINGAMQVAQRGTSVSVSTSANTFLTDRFFSRIQGSTGTATASQVSDAPVGFTSSLKLTVGTADTSLGSADYTRIHQDIEGYNCIGTGWNTNSGVPVTLSFWVKSSIAGTYSIALYNSDASRSIVKEYTIDAASTWEYKTLTIPPNNATWAFDNGYGIRLTFSLGAGSTYICTEANLEQWTSNFDFSSPNNVNIMATSGATFQITGVQLELGKVATPFEHRSYGEELALCQRYYYRIDAGQVGDRFSLAECSSTTQADGILSFPVTMRSLTGPTGLDQSGTASDYAVYTAGGSNICSAVPTFIRASNNTALFKFTTSSGLTAGNAAQLISNTTDAYLAWSDEL